MNNAQQAFAWYRKAADAGNADAMYLMGSSYSYVNGRGVAEGFVGVLARLFLMAANPLLTRALHGGLTVRANRDCSIGL
jgi:TPR repeat protein